MKIRILELEIENFRSIKKSKCYLRPYSVFVGKNNSGKSNFMKALFCFFNNSVSENDFRKEGQKKADYISIIVVYGDLSDAEKEFFAGKLTKDEDNGDLLKIGFRARKENGKIKTEYFFFKSDYQFDSEDERFAWYNKKPSSITKRAINDDPNIPEDFKEYFKNHTRGIRRISEEIYLQIKKEYIDEKISKDPSMKPIMVEKEFPFSEIKGRNVSKYLGRYFFIPAVQDIEKETRYTLKSKTTFANIINFIISRMEGKSTRGKLKEDIERSITQFYNLGDEESEINKIKNRINQYLNRFDGSSLIFRTSTPDISSILRDSLEIKVNDGVETDIDYKGHGLQRYLLINLFRIWAELIMEKSEDEEGDLTENNGKIAENEYALFAIEEPELFLHPQYQRLIQEYLEQISNIDNNQVILNTHSPNFINFRNLISLIRVVKENDRDGTNVIQVHNNPYIEFYQKELAEKKQKGDKDITPEYESISNLVRVWGDKKKRAHFRKLNIVNMSFYLNTARNEMFFADKVVFVEGQTEAMILDLWARYFLSDYPDAVNGVSYIECIGKQNLFQFMHIAGIFRIPYVVIFDRDLQDSKSDEQKDKIKRTNSSLKDLVKKMKRNGFVPDADFVIFNNNFEEEFGLQNTSGNGDNAPRNKPKRAIEYYFDIETMEPKKDHLEQLRKMPKLKEFIRKVYGVEIDDS